jgi:short-subunit dehydrogenase
MHLSKVVLITGASSGIGQAMAQLLADDGCTVFGTSRVPSSRPANYELLPLDVCQEQSARGCVDTVIQRAGRLDVLINNAGYTLSGAIEETTIAQAEAQFETNFFGAARMIKYSLPGMRRQGQGQIINVGSGMSLVRAPFLGIYAASKCALDGYSEALWHELKPFNIKVSVIQPGFVRTAIDERAQVGAEPLADYQFRRDKSQKTIQAQVRAGDDASLIARCVRRIIQQKRPALYYQIGKNTRALALLRRLSPQPLFGWIIRQYFQLDQLP